MTRGEAQVYATVLRHAFYAARGSGVSTIVMLKSGMRAGLDVYDFRDHHQAEDVAEALNVVLFDKKYGHERSAFGFENPISGNDVGYRNKDGVFMHVVRPASHVQAERLVVFLNTKYNELYK
ncbi:hypothetical protein FJY94_03320 [Candidatus Kaiserbacteria bacterium]|nr:hypothetical protein [Candidatus Kaiserbacteria bacterium]